MTNTPAEPEDEDMALSELMEHRDLQKAQLRSMAHIWDNPLDERWNDMLVSADETDAPSSPATTPRFANLSEYTAWLLTQPPTARTTEEIDQYIRDDQDSRE